MLLPAKNITHPKSLSVDETTEPIIAVIGHPIAGNPTQFALETGFQTARIDCRVLSIDLAPDKVAIALAGMRAMNFRAVWITPSCRSGVDLADVPINDTFAADPAQRGGRPSATSLLDVLADRVTDPVAASWTFQSLKERIWPGLAHEILMKQNRACSRLWWIDSRNDLSPDSQREQKEAVLHRVGSHLGERWQNIGPDQIEIVSDLAQVLLHEFQDDGFNVVVVADSNTAPRTDWQSPPHSLVIDLNENWQSDYLAAWDRIKQSTLDDFSRECVRGADVHAICLAKLTEMLFQKRVSPEVFLEAIDEYLAV